MARLPYGQIVRLLYDQLFTDSSFEEEFSSWRENWESIHDALGHKKSIHASRVLSQSYGLDEAGLNVAYLLFAIETYLVFYLRATALFSLTAALQVRAPSIALPSGKEVSQLLRRIFQSETFLHLGVANFGSGAQYGWVCDVQNDRLLEALAAEIVTIADDSLSHPTSVGDRFQTIHHLLIPKMLRHSIGAYYTPDWLADHVLASAGFSGTIRAERLLDPHCGSGSFLIAALRKVKAATVGQDTNEWYSTIEKQICGLDIDPVAVTAAKANIVCFISELLSSKIMLRRDEPLALPIHQADSIYTSEFSDPGALRFTTPTITARVAGKSYEFPKNSVADLNSWGRIVGALVYGALRGQTLDLTIEAFELPRNQLQGLAAAYLELKARTINGTHNSFAEMLIDSVAPYAIGGFDIVAGNPPWVNWEYIPRAYKELTKPLWVELGLFDSKGRDKGFSKEDLSTLATYVACDRYLKTGGTLAFLMPQSVFQSTKNSKGFRRFRLGVAGPELQIEKVEDLSDITVFAQASNRTAILYLKKGAPSSFPIKCVKWDGRRSEDTVLSRSSSSPPGTQEGEFLLAWPRDRSDLSSAWVYRHPDNVKSAERLEGRSPYKARTGVFTGGANAIFYVRILQSLENGNLIVQNITDRAKKKVDQRTFEIERQFVFPFLRGRDVDVWKAEVERSNAIICPHSALTGIRPIEPAALKAKGLLTFAYLTAFEAELRDRGGLTGMDATSMDTAFYTLLRVGSYTFSPYKVVWRYISRDFKCAVVGPADLAGEPKLVIPQEKLVLLDFTDADEAYFVCGLLSSDLIRTEIQNRMIGTQISASIIENICLPKFDEHDSRHREISKACRIGHEKAAIHEDFTDESLFVSCEVDRLFLKNAATARAGSKINRG